MQLISLIGRLALALLLSAAGIGPSLGQAADEVRYYEATTAGGGQAPKPDPWCELAQFGTRSLWACPTMKPTGGQAGDNNGRAGGPGGGGGGMDSGGGMDGGGGMDD